MDLTKNQENILNDNSLSEDERVSKLIEDKVANGGEELTDPFSISAGLYGLYYPKAMGLIDNLSGNAIKRVLKMVISSHLEETPLKSQTKNEGDLYQIVEKLMEAKTMMIISTYMKSLEQSNLQQSENNVSLEEKKEENNGQV